jgi:hypothetical protein
VHSLPQKLHFTSSEMVIQLVERGRGLTDQERGLMLDPNNSSLPNHSKSDFVRPPVLLVIPQHRSDSVQ